MLGREIKTILLLMEAMSVPRVVLDKAIHL